MECVCMYVCVYVCMHVLCKHLPTTAANNRWITARSPNARMRAVLSDPPARVEQNPALLHCGRLLKSGRGVKEGAGDVYCGSEAKGRDMTEA